MSATIYNKVVEVQKGKRKAALCTIVATKGSAPLKAGGKMIVWEDGELIGTVGGGNLEKKVIENALMVVNEGIPQLFHHELLRQHGMCCGGNVDIYIEPIMQKKKLYIFGAGHTGKAISRHALNLDFDIFLIDNRKKEFENFDLKGVDKMPVEFSEILPKLPFDEQTYIIIVTYDHQIDRQILAHCIRQPHAYLGMIGSQRKVEVTKKMFKSGKLATEKELKAVDMPIGLNIHAEGHEEIAVSILAKIIEVKNKVVK